MKRIAIVLFAGWALLRSGAAELEWLSNLPQAQTKAKAEKKMVLLDFTGSDWCIWCIRLNQEIFSKPEFAEFAKKNLVLVEVDFPRKKQLSQQQQKANQALADKYEIRGYPTLIILNSNGEKVGTLGYMPGGPEPLIEQLVKLKPK
jgi:thioredoxin-related protein